MVEESTTIICDCGEYFPEVIDLLTQTIQLQQSQYVLSLFVLGCTVAVFVLFLLYKFIKLFF